MRTSRAHRRHLACKRRRPVQATRRAAEVKLCCNRQGGGRYGSGVGQGFLLCVLDELVDDVDPRWTVANEIFHGRVFLCYREGRLELSSVHKVRGDAELRKCRYGLGSNRRFRLRHSDRVGGAETAFLAGLAEVRNEVRRLRKYAARKSLEANNQQCASHSSHLFLRSVA
jgi:hypothetical protein